MMTFSEKLVVLRKIKHLTQDEFASAVGVSRQAVYKWESGQSYPEVQKLREMKMLFNISIDDLLDDTYEIELPKKKRKRRKANAENTEEVKEEIVFKKDENAVVEEKPVVEKKAPVEKKNAAPKAKPVVEEAKVEEVVEEAPVVEEVVEAAEVAEVAEETEETVVAKKEPKVYNIQAPAPKEINDPTENYAKKGGLFGRIFAKR